jgi:hypothetical protein
MAVTGLESIDRFQKCPNDAPNYAAFVARNSSGINTQSAPVQPVRFHSLTPSLFNSLTLSHPPA